MKVICDHALAGKCLYKGCPHSRLHKPIKDCKTECGLIPAAKCVEAPE